MKYSNIAIPEDIHIKLKIYCATHGNITIKEAVKDIMGDYLSAVTFTGGTELHRKLKSKITKGA